MTETGRSIYPISWAFAIHKVKAIAAFTSLAKRVTTTLNTLNDIN